MLRDQVEAKFVDGLRSVAATMSILELQEKRADFVKHVQTTVEADVQSNGLAPEGVPLMKCDRSGTPSCAAQNWRSRRRISMLGSKL